MTGPLDSRLRLGVVGCGAVATIHHLPAAGRLGLAVEVVVDRDRERAEAVARRFAVPLATSSLDEAAARIDAAVVTVPNRHHAEVSCDLLRRGVHVLVEKPMAASTAECDAMIAAAEAARRVLAVGLEFRFFSFTRWLREALDDGLVGPLRGFDLRLGVVSRWPFATDHFLKPGGGVLADYGSHLLDLLLVWLGDLEVTAYRDDARGGVESDCELELESSAGVAGRVEISRTRTLRNTLRLDGERGRLELGLWDPDPLLCLAVDGRELALEGRIRRDGNDGEAVRDFETAFDRQLADFLAAAAGGGEPAVPGREGRRSIALLEGCAALRRPLALPWEPFRRREAGP